MAELKHIFETKRTPYIDVLQKIESSAGGKAKEILGPELEFGMLNPVAGQYAEVVPRPEMFSGMAGTALSDDFRQNLTSTGWQRILSANLSDTGEVKANWVLGIAGIAILDPAKRITQIKIVKGDRTFSVLDIEDIQAFDGPVAIVFKIPDEQVDLYVFDYSATFELYADIISTGYQTVKPLGVAYLPQAKAIAETY